MCHPRINRIVRSIRSADQHWFQVVLVLVPFCRALVSGVGHPPLRLSNKQCFGPKMIRSGESLRRDTLFPRCGAVSLDCRPHGHRDSVRLGSMDMSKPLRELFASLATTSDRVECHDGRWPGKVRDGAFNNKTYYIDFNLGV